MNIKVRLSSVLLIVAAFVLLFVSFNSLASAKSGTEGLEDRQLQSHPEGTINAVVPGGPGFVSVAGPVFTPRSNWFKSDSSWGYLCDTGETTFDGQYVAPIPLPHGATVTKFVVYYFDASDGKNLDAQLIRRPSDTKDLNTMARVVSSSNSYDYTYGSDDSIEFASVDNQSNSYFAEVKLPAEVGYNVCLIGVRVDYTFPGYLPCVTK